MHSTFRPHRAAESHVRSESIGGLTVQHLYVGVRIDQRPTVFTTAGGKALKTLTPNARYGKAPEYRPDWGADGRGAQELAWMLLLDTTGDRQLADRLHAAYATTVLAGLPHNVWRITRHEIIGWIINVETPATGPGARPAKAQPPAATDAPPADQPAAAGDEEDEEIIDMEGLRREQ